MNPSGIRNDVRLVCETITDEGAGNFHVTFEDIKTGSLEEKLFKKRFKPADVKRTVKSNASANREKLESDFG